jgi:uncharacterized protein (TIRG00374 family)
MKIKYLLLLAVFAVLSYFSLEAVFRLASDRSSFLSLGIFSSQMYALAILLLILNYVADAARFYFILKTIHVDVTIRQVIYLTLINYFTSNLTPFAIGGGVAQIYFLNRNGIPAGAATAGITIKTVLPVLFFMMTAPVILLFDQKLDRIFPNRSSFLYVSILVVLTILTCVFLFYLQKNPDRLSHLSEKMVQRFGKTEKRSFRLKKISGEVRTFLSHLSLFFSGSKNNIFLSILTTLLFLLTLFLFPVLLIRDLNSSVSAAEIILSQIVITFVMYFAPTPGSSGVAEAAFILLFSNDVSKGELVSLTFVWRMFTMYLGIFFGMVVFYAQLFRSKAERSGKKKEECS